ncbi:hypothetical protein IAU59_004629 [Kwoniella sp. CBS 9459]
MGLRKSSTWPTTSAGNSSRPNIYSIPEDEEVAPSAVATTETASRNTTAYGPSDVTLLITHHVKRGSSPSTFLPSYRIRPTFPTGMVPTHEELDRAVGTACLVTQHWNQSQPAESEDEAGSGLRALSTIQVNDPLIPSWINIPRKLVDTDTYLTFHPPIKENGTLKSPEKLRPDFGSAETHDKFVKRWNKNWLDKRNF